MSFKIRSQKKIDLNKVKLVVEITNNILKKNISKAYDNISSRANMPGFRKGKIPYKVIDLNYGKQYVLNEAASLSISELYPDIIKQSGLSPIDYPRIRINQLKEDLPLGFELELDLEPEIELPRYKGIRVTGISTDVSDEELNTQIDNIRGNFASLEPVGDERPVKKGDYVTLDFDGKIEGEPFSGSSEQDYLLEVGSDTMFTDFENSLIGVKKGEIKEVSLKLPEDSKDKETAGKKADYKISVKEIKAKKLPELDEAFLKNMGDYEDEEDFRKTLKEKLVEQKENFRKEKIVKEILDHMVDNMKSSVPEVMIKRRVKQINEEIDKNLKNQNITRKDYINAVKITEDKLNKEIRDRAEREIKEYLIFKALEKAERKNIELPEDEVNKEKENILTRYKSEEDIKKVKKFFESEDGRETIVQTLKRRKIIDILVNNAKIEEIKDKTGDDRKNKKLWTPGSK
ncbi:MAG: trigger factor [Actinomycetota bacterium]|nr:trigger factor [Actinomycetota bacterium]